MTDSQRERCRGQCPAEDPDLREVIERLRLQVSHDLELMRQRCEWSEEQLETAASVPPESIRCAVLNLNDVARMAYAMGWLVDVRFRRPRGATSIAPPL